VGRWKYLSVPALVALILVEYLAVPLPLTRVAVGPRVPRAYAYLAAQPSGQPVVEIPMGEPAFPGQIRHADYVYYSLYHWQPLVNGYSGFIPQAYYDLVAAMKDFPSAETVQRLKEGGAVFVLVHSDRLRASDQIARTLDALPGIQHVKNFGSIWLYRIQ
jgi:hypothetical protein